MVSEYARYAFTDGVSFFGMTLWNPSTGSDKNHIQAIVALLWILANDTNFYYQKQVPYKFYPCLFVSMGLKCHFQLYKYTVRLII